MKRFGTDKFCRALCLLSLCAECAFSDTIYLEDENEIKGIIVEEYADRVVISTYEGEKPVLKKGIHRIIYDLPEQNLVKLGDDYLARKEFEKAYFYYEKALKLNPKHEIAREKMNYIVGYLFRRSEKEKRQEVERMQEFEDWPASASRKKEEALKELEDAIGMRIDERRNRIAIVDVKKGRAAEDAGLSANDTLISVWGRLTDYMSEEDVARILLDEGFGEIKLGIERDIPLKKEKGFRVTYKDIIGGKLDMLLEGLTLVEISDDSPGRKAGLEKDDLIVSINGSSTRYMPLNDAIRIIETTNNNDVIVFTVRRNMTIWRK